MNIGKLEFNSINKNHSLIPDTILSLAKELNLENEILVAQINPEYADGYTLCEKYDVSPTIGINCLIVEAKRGDTIKHAALLVPIGHRYNMSNIVRKELDARSVSVANLEYVLEKTKMEYGSINPIGIPRDWYIFIDPIVLGNINIIIGGGLKKSKILIPSSLLLKLPNAKILDNLAKRDN